MPRNDLAGNGFTLAVARGLHDGVALLMGMDTLRIEEIFRAEHGRILATLIRLLGDFDAAEEALQEAVATALEKWPTEGTPGNPASWLISTARHKAIDGMRRRAFLTRKQDEIARHMEQ